MLNGGLTISSSIPGYGVRISRSQARIHLINSDCPLDAKVFHHLETWAPSPSDPSSTLFLSQMELFQRHLTTIAYKIAGGVDLSSTSLTNVSKQTPIPAAFITKIIKAFLDALYAFLDGMINLASDQAPPTTMKRAKAGASTSISSANPVDLLDLSDGVRNNLKSFLLCLSFVGCKASSGPLKFRASFQCHHSEYD